LTKVNRSSRDVLRNEMMKVLSPSGIGQLMVSFFMIKRPVWGRHTPFGEESILERFFDEVFAEGVVIGSAPNVG